MLPPTGCNGTWDSDTARSLWEEWYHRRQRHGTNTLYRVDELANVLVDEHNRVLLLSDLVRQEVDDYRSRFIRWQEHRRLLCEKCTQRLLLWKINTGKYFNTLQLIFLSDPDLFPVGTWLLMIFSPILFSPYCITKKIYNLEINNTNTFTGPESQQKQTME